MEALAKTEAVEGLVPMDSIDDLESWVNQAMDDSPDVLGSDTLFFKVHQEDSEDSEPGDITVGMEGGPLGSEDLFMMDTRSLKHGWMLREGADIAEVDLVPFNERLPEDPEGKDWHLAYSAEFAGINGENEGVLATFEGCTNGISRMFKHTVMEGLKRQVRKKSGKYFPVMSFDSSFYYSKLAKGNIHKPIAKIQMWVKGPEDIPKDLGGPSEPQNTRTNRAEPAPVPEPSPRVRVRTVHAPEVVEGRAEEVEGDEAPPTRRRRARATSDAHEDSRGSLRRDQQPTGGERPRTQRRRARR